MIKLKGLFSVSRNKRIKIKKDGYFITNGHLSYIKENKIISGINLFEADYDLFVDGKNIGVVFDINKHNSWGNSINISNWEKQTYYGWGVFPDGNNIYLCTEMQSGEICLIKLKNFRRGLGVVDQFFADGDILGYIKIG